MARHVKGQGDSDIYHGREFLQISVDFTPLSAISTARIKHSSGDDGQQVITLILRVFVENGLHLARPGNNQGAPG